MDNLLRKFAKLNPTLQIFTGCREGIYSVQLNDNGLNINVFIERGDYEASLIEALKDYNAQLIKAKQTLIDREKAWEIQTETFEELFGKLLTLA